MGNHDNVIAVLPSLTVGLYLGSTLENSNAIFRGWTEETSFSMAVSLATLRAVLRQADSWAADPPDFNDVEQDKLYAIGHWTTIRILAHRVFGVDISFRGFSDGKAWRFSIAPEDIRMVLAVAEPMAELVGAIDPKGMDNLPF